MAVGVGSTAGDSDGAAEGSVTGAEGVTSGCTEGVTSAAGGALLPAEGMSSRQTHTAAAAMSRGRVAPGPFLLFFIRLG